MKNPTNLNLIKMLSFAVCVVITVVGSTIALKSVIAQQKDKIEYNQVYDCGDGKSKFKVVSCKGMSKNDRCEIFRINEYSPGGGFKDSVYRSQIDDSINQGCKIKGRPEIKNDAEEDKKSKNETPASKTDKNQNTAATANKNNDVVACFASDSEANVQNVNEKSFKSVLRNFWEKKPEESGPTVTLTFQKMTIGVPRRWRATFDDAYSQADPKKPIYPVRATFTTCTDYTDAITTRKMERIYDCYVHKTGGWQCSQTGASGPLAMKDEKVYTPKKRP